MLNHELWYNGKSSRAAGVRHIEHFPSMDRPERKVEVFDVPGRNGSIVFPTDSFDNIVREYEIYAGEGTRDSAPPKFADISDWLNSAGGGYARLEDTFEPEIFRLAYCLGGYEAESAFNRFGRATISFYCRPERFLKTGEEKITYNYGGTYPPYPEIYNRTSFWAKPLLYVQCQVGADPAPILFEHISTGKIFYIYWAGIGPSMGLYIDCETMDVYGDTGENLNHFVQIDEFPQLGPGLTRVSLNSDYKLKIVPRWFVL